MIGDIALYKATAARMNGVNGDAHTREPSRRKLKSLKSVGAGGAELDQATVCGILSITGIQSRICMVYTAGVCRSGVHCLFPNDCDNSLMPPLGGVLLQTPTAGDAHYTQPEAKENRKTINKIGKNKTRQLHDRYTYIGPVQPLIGHQVPFSTALRQCLHHPNGCSAYRRR